MTLREREYHITGSKLGIVFCNNSSWEGKSEGCLPTAGGKTVFQISNGYGDAPDLTPEQIAEIDREAKEHDKQFPTHDIRRMIFK